MKDYNPSKIEKKWQKIWAEQKLYETDLASKKPKFYNLVMFPYPSGEYLHMGHGYSFSGADVYARYKRLNGFNVFEPIGYDAFGLPAENFAIKNKKNPKISTAENIKHAEKQLKSWGCMFDWSRIANTSSPEYYKWTQWLFLQLYKQGLAYQKEAPVNWCPKCLTVLANEQVINGICERCDSEVVQKNMKQWFFKTTEYAEKLINDLDKVDWPKSSVIKQKNWIGRSEGTLVKFQIINSKLQINSKSQGPKTQNSNIKVFTTRVDTIFGCTYLVLAPEHPLVDELTTKEQKKEVEKYKIKTQKLSEIDRQLEEREKTGVFTGSYVTNPFNNEEVPVWVADYVLSGYGTGAVMAVPAHDERDFEFAKKYNLPIKISIAPFFTETSGKDAVRANMPTVRRKTAFVLVKHWSEDKYLCLDWEKFGWHSGVIGGIEGNEVASEAATREIIEETGYQNPVFVKFIGETMHTAFYAAHKKVNRYADGVGMLFKLKNDLWNKPKDEETVNHKAVWIDASKMDEFLNLKNFQYMWKVLNDEKECFTEDGVLVNSGEYNDLSSSEARKKMSIWIEKRKLGGKKINYRLRDWSIGRQRYWGAPIPIINCEDCGIQTVPEKDLPVILPEIKDFRPKGTGKGPLETVSSFVNTTCPKCGGKARRETDTMDTFVCSSFYFLRYPSVGNPTSPRLPTPSKLRWTSRGASEQMMDKEVTKKWLPVDMYVGGAEHVTMHLLYARFVTKALYDAKLINFSEPFLKLRHQGMILGPDGKKMSKSKGNIVVPDETIKQWGVDTFRVTSLFMGPFEDGGPWNEKGLFGIEKFLYRYWRLAQDVIRAKELTRSNENIGKVVNTAIKKVGSDIENFKFNTATSSLMICLNSLVDIKNKEGIVAKEWKEAIAKFSILLSPLAPHIAEEIWEQLGNKESIFNTVWPKFDEKSAIKTEVNIVVQINGKVRDQITVTQGLSEEAVLETALKSEKIKKHLEGKEIKKKIFVKDKILNLVV